MKNKFKVILVVSLAACLLTFAFTGCTQQNAERGEQGEMFPERDVPNAPNDNIGRNSDNQNSRNNNLLGDNPRDMNDAPLANDQRNATGLDQQTPMKDTEQQTGFDKNRTDKIITQLNKVEGISEVNAVVNDNTAIVVYTPRDTNSDLDETDNMVAEKVKDIDNKITKVKVSHSADVMTKVKELTNNIANNKPVEELNNMFEQLMRTINPQS